MAKKGSTLGSAVSTILILIILALAAAFVYKVVKLDYKGAYANETVTYSKEYGITLLLKYKPEYKAEEVDGYAITNIPVKELFGDKIAKRTSGKSIGDSKEILEAYKLQAVFGNNDIINALSSLLSENSKGTKSIPVGKKGNYFIYTFKEFDEM